MRTAVAVSDAALRVHIFLVLLTLLKQDSLAAELGAAGNDIFNIIV